MVSLGSLNNYPRGSIYTTILGLGPQNHNGDGLLGPNSIVVVYMDPLGTDDLYRNPPAPAVLAVGGHRGDLVHGRRDVL